MIILSWNRRGFNSKLKDESLKYLKGMVNPSIILLQEKKIEAKSIMEATRKFYKTTSGRAVSS
jgi:exonuclease III